MKFRYKEHLVELVEQGHFFHVKIDNARVSKCGMSQKLDLLEKRAKDVIDEQTPEEVE